MATLQKRIVDKWLADTIDAELTALAENNGCGTIFAVLSNVANLDSSELDLVEKQMRRELSRLRKASSLPSRWAELKKASDQ